MDSSARPLVVLDNIFIICCSMVFVMVLVLWSASFDALVSEYHLFIVATTSFFWGVLAYLPIRILLFFYFIYILGASREIFAKSLLRCFLYLFVIGVLMHIVVLGITYFF